MNQKILYLLLMISCISIITAARQKGCQMDSQCKLRISEKAPRVIKASSSMQSGFDLSPVRHFVLNS